MSWLNTKEQRQLSLALFKCIIFNITFHWMRSEWEVLFLMPSLFHLLTLIETQLYCSLSEGLLPGNSQSNTFAGTEKITWFACVFFFFFSYFYYYIVLINISAGCYVGVYIRGGSTKLEYSNIHCIYACIFKALATWTVLKLIQIINQFWCFESLNVSVFILQTVQSERVAKVNGSVVIVFMWMKVIQKLNQWIIFLWIWIHKSNPQTLRQPLKKTDIAFLQPFVWASFNLLANATRVWPENVFHLIKHWGKALFLVCCWLYTWWI